MSSLNAVTAALQPAGSFASPDSMGGACNYGECPAWQFTNDHFSYTLPDGTTADFTNFSGTADFTNQSDVKVKGTASGNDSAGTPVQVTVDWAWSASCRSGRGGGCTKTFISGTLTVVKRQTAGQIPEKRRPGYPSFRAFRGWAWVLPTSRDFPN
ncbi:MAG: hypothetical protein DMG99_00315 [Acidobacteria bacterium]|nr:MAG: hypothetical protein DMG99_00315 [Acidobacteriota bacterium]